MSRLLWENIVGGVLLAGTFTLIALEERRRQLAEGTFDRADGLPQRVGGKPPVRLDGEG